jgi:hypothetical protein
VSSISRFMYRGVWFQITERVGLLLQKGVDRGVSLEKNRKKGGLRANLPFSFRSPMQNRGGGEGAPAADRFRRPEARWRPGMGAKRRGGQGESIPPLTAGWGGVPRPAHGGERRRAEVLAAAARRAWEAAGGGSGGCVERGAGLGPIYRRLKAVGRWWPVRGGRRAVRSTLMAPVSWSGGADGKAGATRWLGTRVGTVRRERGVSGRGTASARRGKGLGRRTSRRAHVGQRLGASGGRRDVAAVLSTSGAGRSAARGGAQGSGRRREWGASDGRRGKARARGRARATSGAARCTATRCACACAVARPGQEPAHGRPAFRSRGRREEQGEEEGRKERKKRKGKKGKEK